MKDSTLFQYEHTAISLSVCISLQYEHTAISLSACISLQSFQQTENYRVNLLKSLQTFSGFYITKYIARKH